MSIPRVIYQTWITKDLPRGMQDNYNLMKSRTQGFLHKLFDDREAREFIKVNFKPPVLAAYDTLLPGAYKADLWRYCVLYVNGGVYLDIKLCPDKGVCLHTLCRRPHLPLDMCQIPGWQGGSCIYQGFLVSRRGCLVMREAIRKTVANALGREMGSNCLDVSGPTMLGRVVRDSFGGLAATQVIYSRKDKKQRPWKHELWIGGRRIMHEYSGYREELLTMLRNGSEKTRHYSKAYADGEVFG